MLKPILVIDKWLISCTIGLRLMSLDLADDEWTLVQVMACCRQATRHYLSQCSPRSKSPYGVSRPKWVNYRQRLYWNFLIRVTISINMQCHENLLKGLAKCSVTPLRLLKTPGPSTIATVRIQSCQRRSHRLLINTITASRGCLNIRFGIIHTSYGKILRSLVTTGLCVSKCAETPIKFQNDQITTNANMSFGLSQVLL